MFIHPTVLRHLFVVKAVYTTIALFGVLDDQADSALGLSSDLAHDTSHQFRYGRSGASAYQSA